MQGTWVRSLVLEEPIYRRSHASQLLSLCSRARAPQPLSPHAELLKPVLRSERSHHREKPGHCTWRAAPARRTWRKPVQRRRPRAAKIKLIKKEAAQSLINWASHNLYRGLQGLRCLAMGWVSWSLTTGAPNFAHWENLSSIILMTSGAGERFPFWRLHSPRSLFPAEWLRVLGVSFGFKPW